MDQPGFWNCGTRSVWRNHLVCRRPPHHEWTEINEASATVTQELQKNREAFMNARRVRKHRGASSVTPPSARGPVSTRASSFLQRRHRNVFRKSWPITKCHPRQTTISSTDARSTVGKPALTFAQTITKTEPLSGRGLGSSGWSYAAYGAIICAQRRPCGQRSSVRGKARCRRTPPAG